MNAFLRMVSRFQISNFTFLSGICCNILTTHQYVGILNIKTVSKMGTCDVFMNEQARGKKNLY